MSFDTYGGPLPSPSPYKMKDAGKKGQGVTIDTTAKQIKKNSTAGGSIYGVLLEDCKANEYPYIAPANGGQLRITLRAGEAVTAGERLYCDSDGDFVDAPTTAGTYHSCVAAAEAGSNNGLFEAVWMSAITTIVT